MPWRFELVQNFWRVRGDEHDDLGAVRWLIDNDRLTSSSFLTTKTSFLPSIHLITKPEAGRLKEKVVT
jgi:hypothetical protein